MLYVMQAMCHLVDFVLAPIGNALTAGDTTHAQQVIQRMHSG